MPRILIVTEDEEFISTGKLFASPAFNVTRLSDFETAFHELLESEFEALVVDLATGNKDIDFIKRIRTAPQLKALPILVAAEWGTGYGSLALSLGADACEAKPCDLEDLLASVKRLLTKEHAVAK